MALGMTTTHTKGCRTILRWRRPRAGSASGLGVLDPVGAGDDDPFRIDVWQRSSNQDLEDLVQVSGSEGPVSNFVLVPKMPSLLDHLARWAPITSTATITKFFELLRDFEVRPTGFVERVAGRQPGQPKNCHGTWRRRCSNGSSSGGAGQEASSTISDVLKHLALVGRTQCQPCGLV